MRTATVRVLSRLRKRNRCIKTLFAVVFKALLFEAVMMMQYEIFRVAHRLLIKRPNLQRLSKTAWLAHRLAVKSKSTDKVGAAFDLIPEMPMAPSLGAQAYMYGHRRPLREWYRD